MAANTLRQHAVLVALLAKHCLRFGEKGENAFLSGIKRLGIERGTRMAYRAVLNKEKLDIVSFFAFSEWQPDEETLKDGIAMQTKILRLEPTVVTYAESCAWFHYWKVYDLLDYGRLYCKVIDDALVNGFHPELHCKTCSNLSYGDARCEFDWGAAAPLACAAAPLARLDGLKSKLGSSCVKTFDYHIGHVLFSVVEEITALLGSEGIQAVRDARSEFCGIFGKACLDSAEAAYP
jgi:hypothetical protein